MDIFLAQLLNALLYAAVLFLIAGGLSLIFGVVRIVNLAHGSLYALGAYVMAWGLGRLAGEAGSGPLYLLALLPVAAGAVGATGGGLEPLLLRATSQNRRMAAALGINVGGVYVQAFALGCLMAGLAGAVIVPIQGAVLGMGVDALVLAFVVVVIGGLGSLEGALVGALIVGVVRTVAIQYFPELELAVLYLIAAGVLITRPAGLLGRA